MTGQRRWPKIINPKQDEQETREMLASLRVEAEMRDVDKLACDELLALLKAENDGKGDPYARK
jgi:hypothetical protein